MRHQPRKMSEIMKEMAVLDSGLTKWFEEQGIELD